MGRKAQQPEAKSYDTVVNEAMRLDFDAQVKLFNALKESIEFEAKNRQQLGDQAAQVLKQINGHS